MRNVSVAVLVGALSVVPSSAVTARAQEPLTARQMEQLVATAATPAEHGQLSRHFAEMATKLTADADAHASMAAGYRRHRGNSTQPTDDPAAHCERIALRAREGAAAARELATYHERLAAGVPKTDLKAPVQHVAVPMADVQVQEHIVNAGTPAEHVRASQQFAAEAARYAAEAERHAAMPAAYRNNANSGGADPAVHCDRFVQQMRDAAAAARTLATYHRQLATVSAK